jgi:hypothetical protein
MNLRFSYQIRIVYLLLIGCFTALIILITGLSRGNSIEAQVLSFNTCLLPCIFGIIPGETLYADAVEIIVSTVPINQIVGYGMFEVRANDGTPIKVTLWSQAPGLGDSVQTIKLSAATSGGQVTTLGNLLAAGYSPHRVFLNNRTGGTNSAKLLAVFDEYMQIGAVLSADVVVSPDTPIETLLVTAQQETPQLMSDFAGLHYFDYEVGWLGFASVNRYRNAGIG